MSRNIFQNCENNVKTKNVALGRIHHSTPNNYKTNRCNPRSFGLWGWRWPNSFGMLLRLCIISLHNQWSWSSLRSRSPLARKVLHSQVCQRPRVLVFFRAGRKWRIASAVPFAEHLSLCRTDTSSGDDPSAVMSWVFNSEPWTALLSRDM